MTKEKDSTTLLGCEKNPASGGWRWFIRYGNVVTLAEVFYMGHRILSCFDLYRIYLTLDHFAFKRQHSVSNSAEGTRRRNAKSLRHQETGRWGLPS